MSLITVECVYAKNDDNQFEKTVEVESGATVKEVILLSGVLEKFPELKLENEAMTIGIFYELCTLETKVLAGDRVEIYAPLFVDPKTARRTRALDQKKN